jgi:hypothetical protein
MPIKESSRPFMEEMRMLAMDSEGREVLVGLDHAETEWYLAYSDARSGGPHATKAVHDQTIDRQRYLELHDRHELLRRQFIMAEIEARDRLLKN